MRAGRRPRFLAKDELFHVPVVGLAFAGAGQIPVVRGTGDATTALRAAERAIDDGEVVVIYPEGTVTTRPDHLPMQGKTGVVRLSLATGRADHAARELGVAGRLAEVGQGEPEVRPPGLDAGSAARSTCPIAAATPGDARGAPAMTDDVMAVLTAMVEDLRAAYPKRWSDGG